MRLNISLLAPGNACVRYGGSDTTHRLFTVSAGTPSGCTAPQGYLAGRQRPPVRSRREVIAERISACQALEHPTEGTKAYLPPFNRMRTGKQLYPYLKGTRKSISAMAANILH